MITSICSESCDSDAFDRRTSTGSLQKPEFLCIRLTQASSNQSTSGMHRGWMASIDSIFKYLTMSQRKQEKRWFSFLQYRCGFCRDVLRYVPLRGIWWLLCLLGFRQFYCPHCFGISIRPTSWFRWLLTPFRCLYHWTLGRL